MKITCMSCKGFDFDVEVTEQDFRRATIIALVCPQCSQSTAMLERPGGGIQIGLAKYPEKESG